MKATLMAVIFAWSLGAVQAQNEMYSSIPAPPEKFSAGAMAARVLEGLTFRYFWATEGLRPEDLAFKPSDKARTCLETLEHIYEMSILIVHSSAGEVNVPGQDKKLPFDQMRKVTLENFRLASTRLKAATDKDIEKCQFIFEANGQRIVYPFWNMINGPIEDCIWHTGQIVSFRRSSGNPMKEVDLFTGQPGK